MLVVDHDEAAASHAEHARAVSTSEYGDTILKPNGSYDNVAQFVEAVTVVCVVA